MGSAVSSGLSDADRALIRRFEAAGQGHVFRFLEGLATRDARGLLEQAAEVDLDRVAQLAAARAEPEAAPGAIAPPGDEFIALDGAAVGTRRAAAAAAAGMDLLRAGRVSVVVAAGGQGTRLGSDRPKALFPVGPLTRRSLLGWLAAKLRHWNVRLGRSIPLVLMLSDATERATLRHLADHGHFGLEPDSVHSVVQGCLPPLDDDGRLLLATRAAIALAPDGHGGLYRALTRSGVAERLAASGITTLSYVQIDNPLVQPVDPVFLGHHAQAGSRISSKSVAKLDAAERVGVFGRVDGRPAVIEYSELSAEQAGATDAAGRLRFGQGSIAAHVIELDFACGMASRGLPLHRARKKVPHVGADGALVQPAAPNATKFETFLFDAIPLAERSLVVETRRADEFSPIKNAAGADSAQTAAADLQALFRRWYERADRTPPPGTIEIDPEDAPDADTFVAWRSGPRDGAPRGGPAA